MSAFRQSAASRRWVAIIAAYLLVLQALFTGLASGAHAASTSLDRSPGEMPAPSASDQGAAQHDRTSCCVIGCALTGGGLPAPAASFLPVIHRPVDLVAFARHLDAPQGYVAGRSPANPRAPPSVA